MLKRITIVLILVTWPLSLFLNNTQSNFINYATPAILILFSYFLHTKNYKQYYLPLLLIPFIQPKLAVLPLLFLWMNFNKKNILPLILSLLIFFAFVKPFFGQTIFRADYEAGQQVLIQQKLYPSVFLARLFQNKARIPLEKISNNFFALTDPNNYFFGFAPGQIKIDNQNLDKFPFLSILFLLIGFYFLNKNKDKKFLITIFITAILNLSILTNFDRNDFILWVPLFLVICEGLNIFNKKFKYAKFFELIFIVYAAVGLVRIFIMK